MRALGLEVEGWWRSGRAGTFVRSMFQQDGLVKGHVSSGNGFWTELGRRETWHAAVLFCEIGKNLRVVRREGLWLLGKSLNTSPPSHLPPPLNHLRSHP
jgi:hypothetical protein